MADKVFISIEGEMLELKFDKYISGGGKAIRAYTLDGEPWGELTINVEGVNLDKDEVILSHNLTKSQKNAVIKQLGSGWTRDCKYGFVTNGVIMELGSAIRRKWN